MPFGGVAGLLSFNWGASRLVVECWGRAYKPNFSTGALVLSPS